MKIKILILVLGIFVLVVSAKETISQKERDIFASIFDGATYETVIIYCHDATMFVYTEEAEGSVFLKLSWLRRKLKTYKKTMRDIHIIIHNHLPHRPLCRHFSPADRRMLQLLRNKGFRGLYALWVDGDITQIKEVKKDTI